MTPDLLIQHGTLLDPDTGETRTADVLIRDGRIAQIGEDLEAEGRVETYDASGKMISPGWMDMHVHLREPGQEHKETIETGTRAAAFGGFTAVACMPNTDPPIATRDVVEFVRKRAEGLARRCLSHRGRLESAARASDLAELGDMAEGGAVAFSDDGSPVQDARAHAPRARIRPHARQADPRPRGGPHAQPARPHARGRRRHPPRRARHPRPRRRGDDRPRRHARRVHRRPVHVCHISTAKAVDIVRRGESEGHRRSPPRPARTTSRSPTRPSRRATTTRTRRCTRRSAPPRTWQAHQRRAQRRHHRRASHRPRAARDVREGGRVHRGAVRHPRAGDVLGPRRPRPDPARRADASPRPCASWPSSRARSSASTCRSSRKAPTANLTIFDAETEWTFEARHIRSKCKNTPFVGAPMVGRAWAIYNHGQFVEAASAEAEA